MLEKQRSELSDVAIKEYLKKSREFIFSPVYFDLRMFERRLELLLLFLWLLSVPFVASQRGYFLQCVRIWAHVFWNKVKNGTRTQSSRNCNVQSQWFGASWLGTSGLKRSINSILERSGDSVQLSSVTAAQREKRSANRKHTVCVCVCMCVRVSYLKPFQVCSVPGILFFQPVFLSNCVCVSVWV